MSIVSFAVTGLDVNPGTQASPKLTFAAMNTALAAGNIVELRPGDTFTPTLCGAGATSTLILAAVANNTVRTWDNSATKAVVDGETVSVVVTSITVALGTATALTATDLGLSTTAVHDYVDIAGTDQATCNISTPVTRVDATHFTFPLAGTFVANGGTATRQWNTKTGFANGANIDGCAVSNIRFTRVYSGIAILQNATGLTSFTGTDVDIDHCGDHGISHTGTTGVSTGMAYLRVNTAYCRNDGTNANPVGGAAPSFTVTCTDCTATRAGYNFDDTPMNQIAGFGDGFSVHNANVMITVRCTATWCYQGGITHPFTTGSGRAENCYVAECSKNGIDISGGGTFAAIGCMAVAPVLATFQTLAVPHANISIAGTGTGQLINCTSVTARGGATGAVTDCYAYKFGNTATVELTNCAGISNGVAGLCYLTNTTLTDFVSNYNFWSHSTALFFCSTGAAQTFAAYQGRTITAAAHTIGEAASKTGGAVTIKGGSAPATVLTGPLRTACADFAVQSGSTMIGMAQDQTARVTLLTVPQAWLTDALGHARVRGGLVDAGALAFVPAGGGGIGAGVAELSLWP